MRPSSASATQRRPLTMGRSLRPLNFAGLQGQALVKVPDPTKLPRRALTIIRSSAGPIYLLKRTKRYCGPRGAFWAFMSRIQNSTCTRKAPSVLLRRRYCCGDSQAQAAGMTPVPGSLPSPRWTGTTTPFTRSFPSRSCTRKPSPILSSRIPIWSTRFTTFAISCSSLSKAASSRDLASIQILLKVSNHPSDLVWFPQIRHSVGDRVVVLQPQQGRQLVLVELFHADADVVRQHEVEKDPLFVVELSADDDLRPRGALFAGDWRKGVGHVGQHVKQVTLLRVDNPLHRGQLLAAKALLRETLQELLPRIRCTPERSQLGLVLEELGEPAKQHFHELLR